MWFLYKIYPLYLIPIRSPIYFIPMPNPLYVIPILSPIYLIPILHPIFYVFTKSYAFDSHNKSYACCSHNKSYICNPLTKSCTFSSLTGLVHLEISIWRIFQVLFVSGAFSVSIWVHFMPNKQYTSKSLELTHYLLMTLIVTILFDFVRGSQSHNKGKFNHPHNEIRVIRAAEPALSRADEPSELSGGWQLLEVETGSVCRIHRFKCLLRSFWAWAVPPLTSGTGGDTRRNIDCTINSSIGDSSSMVKMTYRSRVASFALFPSVPEQ